MKHIHSYKNRTAQVGQMVEVYRNLHNGLISIRDAKTKHVLGHATSVCLTDATFKVSQAGRERVLAEKRKNVHAVVKGRLQGNLEGFTMPLLATYNPYKYDSFVNAKTEEALQAASKVHVSQTGTIEYIH